VEAVEVVVVVDVVVDVVEVVDVEDVVDVDVVEDVDDGSPGGESSWALAMPPVSVANATSAAVTTWRARRPLSLP
jgi:hypothetical protein